VQPGAGQGGNGLVDGRDQRPFGENVMAHDLDLVFQILGDPHAIGGKQHHSAEAALDLVRQGRVQFDVILGQDQRDRTCASAAPLAIEKAGKAGMAHGLSSRGRAANSTILCSDASER